MPLLCKIGLENKGNQCIRNHSKTKEVKTFYNEKVKLRNQILSSLASTIPNPAFTERMMAMIKIDRVGL